MNATILNNADVSYLDSELLSNDKLIIRPFSFFKHLNHEHLVIWCHKHGIYCVPTTELIDWLTPHIIKDKTIEIGAGNGAIGRVLNIPITDSCYMRNNQQVILTYTLMRQPLTKYPDDIIELDAISAINHYAPDVVIGSWITHKYNPEQHEREGNMFGVDEQIILDNVKKYIMIGNESVHKQKPILEKHHIAFKADWLISRSMHINSNIIYIWEKQ
jgi:hypothetical protein